MHTLSTLLYTHMYARMHLSSYIHVHTHALIKGVLNQGQSPQRTPLLQAHQLHTCIHTQSTLLLQWFSSGPRRSAISQSSQPPSSWNNLHAILQQNIEECTLTHTHTQQPLCTHTLHTLHSHAHTNQGCTEPGAEPPTYSLATCSPTTHTHTHTHKPTVLVRHSLPSSSS